LAKYIALILIPVKIFHGLSVFLLGSEFHNCSPSSRHCHAALANVTALHH
jgi:hypothetical protein